MKPSRNIAWAGAALLLAVGGWRMMNFPPSEEAAPIAPETFPQPRPAEALPPPVLPPEVAVEPAPAAPPVAAPDEPLPQKEHRAARTMAQAEPAPPIKARASPPSVRPTKRVKEPIRDPLAREALGWVGADPGAEEYWLAAINDPSLPADERKDLIEDLNEDGLSDPKHPTSDDLPLIVSRLRLIEAVGGEPMDEVNADAFWEAYKDLINLAYVATGSGEPVK